MYVLLLKTQYFIDYKLDSRIITSDVTVYARIKLAAFLSICNQILQLYPLYKTVGNECIMEFRSNM